MHIPMTSPPNVQDIMAAQPGEQKFMTVLPFQQVSAFSVGPIPQPKVPAARDLLSTWKFRRTGFS